MRDETRVLLGKCCAAKDAELSQDQMIEEIRALNLKYGQLMTRLTELRVEHAEVHVTERDRTVRGRVYELGSKLSGIERVIRKAQEENQRVLEGLRDFEEISERLHETLVAPPPPVEEVAPVVADPLTAADPFVSLRTSNTEARIERGLEPATGS